MKSLLPLFLLFSLSAFAQSTLVTSMLKEAKLLDQQAREEEALQVYLKVLQADTRNFEATWNASFLYAKIGNRQTDLSEKKTYFNTSKQYAEKALQLNATDADANYAMAVAMGRMALISPPKEKVAASRDIKKYAELAIRYNPAHSGAYHVLGLWNYEVANLNFAERSAAKYLFGGIPEGTLEQAIMNFVKAIKLDPHYILYYLDLARALKTGQYQAEAIKTLDKALTLQPVTEDDPVYLKQCREMRSQLE